MATTRLITHHISKGVTIAQSLSDRFDYGQNPEKTEQGEWISAYQCDPETADAEFLLSKAKYKAVTGREQKKDADVLCYQIRQAFVPGEITPEEANRAGYETAMRWTKGKHAFFVATHIDRKHIHNHVYFNSTSLDCTRKFRNFWNSSFALRRLSDRVCLENGLSYIKHPKQHSKGQYKHYGQWLGGNKPLTFQERLKAQIDICLAEKPSDMDAFLQAMAAAGFEVKHGRGGVLSFRAEGQERFTRLRSTTLGEGYGQEDIQAVIEGRAAPSKGRAGTAHKVNLIINIQSRMRTGKGPAYERWAKVFNLKQMAATLQYLQENDLLEYEQLEQRATDAADRFHALSDKIKTIETAAHTNADLMAATVDYAKTRAVFDGYKAVKVISRPDSQICGEAQIGAAFYREQFKQYPLYHPKVRENAKGSQKYSSTFCAVLADNVFEYAGVFGVNSGCRLVKEQHARIVQHGADKIQANLDNFIPR